MTEKEIVNLLKSQNEKGVSELLKHYRPLMIYVITPVLSNTEDQEECISEVVMKVWNYISKFDEQKSSFKTWLTAVTRNTALNHLRKNIKHNQVDKIPESIVSRDGNPEDIILNKEKREQLSKILNNLSGKERTIFYRKYYYMQSTSQIAREMGISNRAAEGKLYRIKQKIRKQMGGWQDE